MNEYTAYKWQSWALTGWLTVGCCKSTFTHTLNVSNNLILKYLKKEYRNTI